MGRVRIGRHCHDLTVSSGPKTGQSQSQYHKSQDQKRSARALDKRGAGRKKKTGAVDYCGFCSLFFLCSFFLLCPFLSDFLSADAEEAGGAA